MKHSSCMVLAGLVLAFAPACDISIGGGEEFDDTESASDLKRHQPTKVRARRVERREMVKMLTTSREVQSEQQIEIFPRAQGVVIELLVEEGDRVEADQVLAVLDQRDAKAAVDDARIALKEARDSVDAAAVAKNEANAAIEGKRLSWEKCVRDFERNEKASLISVQELDQLRAMRDTAFAEHTAAKLSLDRSEFEEKAAGTGVDRAQVALDRAELALSYTEVVAPIAGVIAMRSIRLGDSVSSAAPAFVLTDHENLIVVFPRPQRELALFSQVVRRNLSGTPLDDVAHELEISATAEALPGATFKGQIQRISPTIDPQNGSFRVTARLEQPDIDSGTPRLLPGMLVQLSIITERHPDALVVPKRALKREGDVDLIFLATDDKAERVVVEEGFSDDDNVEVFPQDGQALGEEDLVIFVGNRDLEDGSDIEVEVWDENGPVDGDRWADDSEPAEENTEDATEVATEAHGAEPGDSGDDPGEPPVEEHSDQDASSQKAPVEDASGGDDK